MSFYVICVRQKAQTLHTIGFVRSPGIEGLLS